MMPGVEWVLSPGGLGGAGGGAALAVALSGVHLLAHFRNYHEPVRQRYTVRVVLMVPVYAVDSLLSLLLSKAGPRGAQAAFVVNTCRDVYEAYCLYNFLQLCLCFVGGQAALVYLWQSENREIPSSWLFGTCLMKNVNLDHRFLRLVLLGSLQFVIVKIVLAAALIPLELLGLYAEGEWRLDRAFVYTTVLYNLSILEPERARSPRRPRSLEDPAPASPSRKGAIESDQASISLIATRVTTFPQPFSEQEVIAPLVRFVPIRRD